jgi:methionine synthase II (cobalamin-independent)
MKKRVPHAAGLIVQLDEPALPGVLKGTVPTASGFGKLRAVEEAVARELLAGVLQAVHDAGAETAVHCCAPDVPIDLLRKAGADYISFDATSVHLETARDEQLGEAIEAGVGLMLGVVPATDPARAADVSVNRLLDKILSLTRLGFSPAQLAGAATITPACGLAGATPPWARQALVLAHRTADALADKAS